MERMKEYIEKAKIIRAIAAEAYHCLTLNKPAEARGYIGAKELIERRKAADVAEVRHGRWIPEICESISKRNRLIEYKVYSCSLCGRSNGRIKKKYCPNCGALMKEDEHEVSE